MRYIARHKRLFYSVLLAVLTISFLLRSSSDYAISVQTAINVRHDAIIYAGLPYINDEYWKDRRGMNAALVWDQSQTRWRGSYHSPDYNIIDGWRAVTDIPAAWQQTVWLYGASTVRDDQTPDRYTKASYLQRLFNTFGHQYRVQNRADDGYDLSWNINALRATPLNKGDVIVFYNGDHDGDAAYFKTQIRQAHDLVVTHGATFYEFVEPQMWSMPLSNDEKIINSTWADPNQEQEAETEWAILEPAVKDLFSSGIFGDDLTHVLDSARQQGVIVHEDWIHTNYRGNAIIARAIYEAIFPLF